MDFPADHAVLVYSTDRTGYKGVSLEAGRFAASCVARLAEDFGCHSFSFKTFADWDKAQVLYSRELARLVDSQPTF